MTEPWNLRTADVRSPNSIEVFYIFCEDEVSEPTYFKYFVTDKIKVNFFPKQRSTYTNVTKAIVKCAELKLFDTSDVNASIVDDGVSVWCVFDRDIELDDEGISDQKVMEGHIAFDESLELARRKGIKTAWSNDAFELWVLLHFKEIDPASDFNHRKAYYAMLTDYFLTVDSANEGLIRARLHTRFNYKEILKKQKKFRSIVRPEMLPNTQLAIKRASELELSYDQDLPNHQKCPCTFVHHLVLELLEKGKKQLPAQLNVDQEI